MKTYIPLLCVLLTTTSVFSNSETNKPLVITTTEKELLSDSLKNKSFIFGSTTVSTVYSRDFILEPNGAITKTYKHSNETRWDVNDSGQLVIYNANGDIQWVLIKSNNNDRMCFEEPNGHFLLERPTATSPMNPCSEPIEMPVVPIIEKEALINSIKEKRFTFGSKVNDVVIDHGFSLKRDGTIQKTYESVNERYWDVNKYGQLVIYNAEEKTQGSLMKSEKDGKLYFTSTNGFYLLER